VIETNLFPVVSDMAAFAFLAETAFVGVVLSMTAVAILWRITMLTAFFVAILTLHLGTRVPSRKREIGPLVIKGFAIQLHYFCLASLVVGMAGATRLVLYTPMKALFTSYILGNRFVLMTIQAQIILLGSLELLMTPFAIWL